MTELVFSGLNNSNKMTLGQRMRKKIILPFLCKTALSDKDIADVIGGVRPDKEYGVLYMDRKLKGGKATRLSPIKNHSCQLGFQHFDKWRSFLALVLFPISIPVGGVALFIVWLEHLAQSSDKTVMKIRYNRKNTVGVWTKCKRIVVGLFFRLPFELLVVSFISPVRTVFYPLKKMWRGRPLYALSLDEHNKYPGKRLDAYVRPQSTRLALVLIVDLMLIILATASIITFLALTFGGSLALGAVGTVFLCLGIAACAWIGIRIVNWVASNFEAIIADLSSLGRMTDTERALCEFYKESCKAAATHDKHDKHDKTVTFPKDSTMWSQANIGHGPCKARDLDREDFSLLTIFDRSWRAPKRVGWRVAECFGADPHHTGYEVNNHEYFNNDSLRPNINELSVSAGKANFVGDSGSDLAADDNNSKFSHHTTAYKANATRKQTNGTSHPQSRSSQNRHLKKAEAYKNKPPQTKRRGNRKNFVLAPPLERLVEIPLKINKKPGPKKAPVNFSAVALTLIERHELQKEWSELFNILSKLKPAYSDTVKKTVVRIRYKPEIEVYLRSTQQWFETTLPRLKTYLDFESADEVVEGYTEKLKEYLDGFTQQMLFTDTVECDLQEEILKAIRTELDSEEASDTVLNVFLVIARYRSNRVLEGIRRASLVFLRDLIARCVEEEQETPWHETTKNMPSGLLLWLCEAFLEDDTFLTNYLTLANTLLNTIKKECFEAFLRPLNDRALGDKGLQNFLERAKGAFNAFCIQFLRNEKVDGDFVEKLEALFGTNEELSKILKNVFTALEEYCLKHQQPGLTRKFSTLSQEVDIVKPPKKIVYPRAKLGSGSRLDLGFVGGKNSIGRKKGVRKVTPVVIRAVNLDELERQADVNKFEISSEDTSPIKAEANGSLASGLDLDAFGNNSNKICLENSGSQSDDEEYEFPLLQFPESFVPSDQQHYAGENNPFSFDSDLGLDGLGDRSYNVAELPNQNNLSGTARRSGSPIYTGTVDTEKTFYVEAPDRSESVSPS